MKSNLILFCALACIFCSLSLSSQNINRENFKFEPLIKPTLPIQDITTIGVKLYYPTYRVNRDTVRKYIDNMKLLRGGFGYLEAEDMYAYREMTVEDEGYDLLIEVAYQPQPLGETWTDKWETQDALGLEVTRWVRRTKTNMPTIVKLTDKSGKVLDMWEMDDEMVISYGDRRIATQIDEGGVSTINWYPFIFSSAAEVEAAFTENGYNFIQRQAVMIRLGEALNGVYQRLFYRTLKDKLFLATASSGKHDYSDLDKALKDGLQAIKTENFNALSGPIGVWEQALSEADVADKKARINLKVSNMLHGNLAVAYMLQENWAKAWDHVLAYDETNDMMAAPDPSTNVTVYSSVTRKEVKQVYALKRVMLDIMQSRKGKSNPVPDKQAKPVDITKEIGKRGRNMDLTLFYEMDKYKDFKAAVADYPDETRKRTSSFLANYRTAKPNYEANPFYPNVRGMGTNLQQLTINAIDHDFVNGNPLPEEVTQLDFLDHLFCFGQGITGLPESISNMKELKWLYLQNNYIEELPESIGELKNLKILNLAKNDLTSLPESIKKLENLNKLILKDNPISPEELEKIKQWIPKKCKLKL